MQQEAIAMTPETTTQGVYSFEDFKAMTATSKAGSTIKVFIFTAIVLCINAVAYL